MWEARRSTNLSQQELRELFTTLNDNWTLSENIKVYLVDDFGTATTVAGKAPGTETTFHLQLEDEAGNISENAGSKRIRIVDTQAPTATVKTQGVEIEARRRGDWTRADLLKFIDGDLQDNWSLPEIFGSKQQITMGFIRLQEEHLVILGLILIFMTKLEIKMATMQNSKSWIPKHRQEP